MVIGHGQHGRAARLLGAAGAMRESHGFPRRAVDLEEHERRVVAARAGLGDVAFAAAWAEGRAMTLEQAIEYALTKV